MDNRSRFSVREEYRSIAKGMQDFQREAGTVVMWYEFDPVNTVNNSVYDEPDESTSLTRWKKPYPVPIYNVNRTEGDRVSTEQGLYTIDSVRMVASYESGLLKLALNWRSHLRDRFVYRDTVFRASNIQVRGEIGFSFDTSIIINGEEVNPEELANTVDFAGFAKLESD
jgi:hypothetical protein